MTDYLKSRKGEDQGEGFFCRFTFGQFFALLVLEVFTLFFIFYLGARYGPEFLGFEKKGAVIVGGAPPAEEGSPKVATTNDPEVAAMAKDLVDKAKTPELKERLAEMLKRAPEGKPGAPADVAAYPSPPAEESTQLKTPSPLAGPEPSRRVGEGGGEGETSHDSYPPLNPLPSREGNIEGAAAAGQMPMRQAQPPADVEKGAVRIKSAENAKYSLQVGSYQQMGEANGAVEKLKAKGYRAFLMIADIPDRGRWYRVRVGGFASREEAKKYQKEFESQEAIAAIVVMNEQ